MKNYISKFHYIFCDKFGRKSRELWRNKFEKKKLRNSDFSIFSDTCIAGIIYHDLGLQFKSPTINVLISASDFVKLLKDLKTYLNSELIFIHTSANYPVAMLLDVRINFLHYKTEEEARQKWEERKNRINWDNMFVICSESDLTYEEMVEFDNLPFDNKIIFLRKKVEGIKSGIYATEKILLNFSNPFGKRYYQKYFDYVKWLNGYSDYVK